MTHRNGYDWRTDAVYDCRRCKAPTKYADAGRFIQFRVLCRPCAKAGGTIEPAPRRKQDTIG